MNFPSSTLLFPWNPSCWLEVQGSDAGTFLQGQFTNELRGARDAVYGLWLNTKGKVLADSFVLPTADGAYRVCSYTSSAAVIRERLESHVIADDVVLVDRTPEMSALTFTGTEGAEFAQHLVRSLGGWCFSGHRFRDAHTEYVFEKRVADEVSRETGSATKISPAEMERRRILSVTPAIPQDIGPEDLPNEAGLETDAISFTKGCYLGQEVMARLKNLGQVRRKLLAVTAPMENVPPLPAQLFVGDRAVGQLRSAVASAGRVDGLALVSLLHLPPDRRLALSPSGPGILTVVATP